jgi:hypothetical protein
MGLVGGRPGADRWRANAPARLGLQAVGQDPYSQSVYPKTRPIPAGRVGKSRP